MEHIKKLAEHLSVSIEEVMNYQDVADRYDNTIEFITKACHSHYELVEALEAMLTAYSLETDYGPEAPMKVHLRAKKQARAALKAAT